MSFTVSFAVVPRSLGVPDAGYTALNLRQEHDDEGSVFRNDIKGYGIFRDGEWHELGSISIFGSLFVNFEMHRFLPDVTRYAVLTPGMIDGMRKAAPGVREVRSQVVKNAEADEAAIFAAVGDGSQFLDQFIESAEQALIEFTSPENLVVVIVT